MSWVGWNAASAPPLGTVATPTESVTPGVQYTPEQWAQMQQQNWQQWAQWQQQYQQWHQQYGAEYQKSMNALSQNAAVAPLVNTNAPPPLPTESKPPPPPPPDDSSPAVPYASAPPKTAGYSTVATPQPASFNTTAAHYKTGPQYNVPPPQFQAASQFRNQRQPGAWQNSNKRTFGQQGTQYEGGKRQMLDNQYANKEKTWANVQQPQPQPQQLQQQQQQTPKILNLEELTEAEKKFDKEFAAWEAQFDKWKEQNANHPDKTQYMEYEKKWESWRNSLLDRREQMRKKRLALLAAPAGSSKNDQPAEMFTKPPPTQNNEPLSFKPAKGFPGEELLQNDAGFLKGSSPNAGGIPGLDLVRDDDVKEEEQRTRESVAEPHAAKGPDLDAISKGINSILGDPKLMNMLSMVSQNQNLNAAKVPAIPRLMDLAPPIFEQPDPEDFSENQRELVTNFDDQTRMSFTNGPSEDYNNGFNGRYRERVNFNKIGNGFNRNRGGRNRAGGFNRHDRFDNFGNDRCEDYEEDSHNNNYEEWNDEDDYDKFHERFNDGDSGENGVPSAFTRGEGIPPDGAVEAAVPASEEEELFVPEIVVDYEHKSIRPAEPEIALEPIYMFDYRHKPVSRIPYPQRPRWLYDAVKNIRQFDPLGGGRFGFEQRKPDFDKSRAFEADIFERRPSRFETSERFSHPKDNNYTNDREYRVRYKEKRDFHKRGHENTLEFEELSDDDFDEQRPQKESGERARESPDLSHATNPANPEQGCQSSPVTPIEDLVNAPGRYNRPARIVIILRGPPGSGKTYLAKLIKDKEVENGGSAPRILSLDDYFLTEHEKQVMEDGKLVKIKEMRYEYEAAMEDSYRQSLVKSFKKTITDGYFNFVIVDNVNDKVKYFGEMWSFAKQNGFQVYICQMDLDPQLCTRRNVHNRSEADIEECIAAWEPTPSHHPMVDATGFLQSFNTITEVEMEEVDTEKEERDPGGAAGRNSMASTNRCDRPAQWKSTSSWTMTSGNPPNQQNQDRRGFDGPTWKNRNNRRR
ncbi:YLP motif-containing protein 1-like isoform X2 [Cylas formicarius]|uniref:YLP motif-containing protein 1-like isoform X2 n=1 Tax=Cylas formicarius TaxID=197179 RepID=UPI00295896D9|nr:YLP motif-containing protein 1-like isoform X2 [Cylas formicarius]